MDARRFDELARAMSAAGPRRGLVRLLAVLPFADWLTLLTGEDASLAKRRRKGRGQDRDKDQGKGRQKVGSDNHKHEHRRRKHNLPHKHKHDNKNKKKKCKPESTAQTCGSKCGPVKNNCKKSVDCGSCACEPTCTVCKICNPETTQCEADPAQVGDPCGDGLVCQEDGQCACQGNSCGGCRACEGGECVPDPSVVCTPSDQCHEAGECDPETGQCTTPRKEDGASCDDGDPCTQYDTCQNGECVGTPKDCSSESDVCNDGVCRADGTCGTRPKQDGTGCNADNNSCTSGDSCQNGVCTPGTGVDCRSQDDDCNRGVCRREDGICVKEPRPNDTACNADSDGCTAGDHCQDGACVAGAPRACPVCQACSGGDCQNVASDARCATICCNGACCDAGEQCVDNTCQGACLALRESCAPSDNQCCQDTPTTCAALASSCYDTGAPQDPRCCRDTRDGCGDDCDCCGLQSCQRGECCVVAGVACSSPGDCCNGDRTTCANGKCCVVDGAFCEGGQDGECCAGECRDNFCQGCLRLQASCDPTNNQCCQVPNERTDCAESFDFSDSNCCRPLGGSCSENDDCCDGQRTSCTNGRCCLGEDSTCNASAECCPGSSCRGGVCRSDVCLEPGEACPSGSAPCCAEEGTTCSGGACCRGIGRPCVQLSGAGDPCCGSETTCGGGDGATCCITDFAGLQSGQGNCDANEQCCSGYCHDPRNICCRPQGAACDKIGPLSFQCCPYLGLTCSGNGTGTCIPCRKRGESCISQSGGNTCCIGLSCENGVCASSGCSGFGEPCQENSACCPGHFCNAEGGACIKSCEVEGEGCGVSSIFPCCGGLTCTGELGSQRCTRS
jgi:hypothetical protein